MSYVEDERRGRFTATKEMIFLSCEVIFTLLVGAVVDYYEEIGNLRGSFIVLGISMLVLILLHCSTMFFTNDKPSIKINESTEKTSIKETFGGVFKNKILYKIVVMTTLWTMANFATTPFYGTYQIKELQFPMIFVSVLAMISALIRVIASRPLGKFADKHSFANMLNICYAAMLLAFLINTFTVPSNGKVFYTIYVVLYAIGTSGINSSSINLVYDFIDEKNIIGAFALSGAIGGVIGFLTTIVVSLLVNSIQANGNIFLGMNVYAQQVVSAIGVLFMIVILVYLNTIVRKIDRKKVTFDE